MRVVAIVQARMGSTRFPGKILVPLCGKPMLAQVLQRIRAANGIDSLIVATTIEREDDVLAEWLESSGIPCFRGATHDVLDRYYRCAKEVGAEVIVRVTADDPLKDPEIVEEAIQILSSSPSIDYVSNTIEPSYPEGLDIEVFRFAALERAAKEALLPSEREHVTPFIWKNPGKFEIKSFKMTPDRSSWRWTVDKENDLKFVENLLKQFACDPMVSYRDLIGYIEAHPYLMEINTGTMRNEGYLKSLNLELKE